MKPMELELGSKKLTLKLDANATVEIEKRLNKSLFSIMMTSNGGFKIPKLGEMLTIIHASTTTANVKQADMMKFYDEFVEGGGTMMQLFEKIQELMEKAGFFDKTETEDSKLTSEEATDDKTLV
ncbi:DUF6096 family protein [Enterococcus sp. AZ109]|uniref:DUF6096 family protein n=1 Tax=Enterococcus sp. AZ109 TaxID=2774634 RepID=UPI003F226229